MASSFEHDTESSCPMSDS